MKRSDQIRGLDLCGHPRGARAEVFERPNRRRSRRPSSNAENSKKEANTQNESWPLPDLEQSKAAVLSSLTSMSGQRTYDHAITDFVDWYCS